ncbi:MAG TPA: ribonuclease HIII [Candidatus Cloacimonas sp.]|jgi:ribonuclease HIII|nr:ribonuclease [Candidatus Cloacimonadota bacterium]HCX72575.1 ribonuclease HIII [Candidatus Cloacimonas sp.]
MNKKLLEYLEKILPLTQAAGFVLADEKEIPYGVQLKFAKADNKIPLNIYFSTKKGINPVLGGSAKNPLRAQLQQVLVTRESELIHSWQIWCGSDESGKGDFFGPLVVAAFVAQKDELPQLLATGVKDSKKITDKNIEQIAKKLYGKFNNRIKVLVLNPLKYNQLYNKFRQQGKKLNELLAWMHGRLIVDLHKEHQFAGAVVDKFASNRNLMESLQALQQIKVKNVVRAEQDPAVAAASVIARYHFLQNMQMLQKKYQMKLPKGATNNVINAARVFSQKYGKNRLKEVAKINFKTIQKV